VNNDRLPGLHDRAPRFESRIAPQRRSEVPKERLRFG
jgi:hypothetical protein